MISDSSTELVVRASRGTYIVFTIMCGWFLLLGTIVAFKNPTAFWYGGANGGPLWQPVVGAFVIWIYCLVWIKSYRITLARGVLSYKTLWGGTLSIPVSDIGEITMSAWSGLRIEARSGTNLKPIIINVPIFAKKDLAKLLDALNVPKTKRRYTIFGKD